MKALVAIKGVLLSLFIFIGINAGAFTQFLAFLFVKPFSQKAFMAYGTWVQGVYLTQLVYFLERNSNLIIEFSGDDVPAGESALILPNHQNHDYLILYSYAFRKGSLAFVRTFLKDSTKFIPGFGASMWLNNWPFLSRDWAKDKLYLKNLFKGYKEEGNPHWLWLFAEGTRLTPKKLKLSQEFAASRNLPVLQHVMLPRTKGFCTTIENMEGAIKAVYDVTIAYSGWGKKDFPGPLDMIFLDPSKKYRLHIDTKRVPVGDLPQTEDGLKDWLIQSFVKKDELLGYYEKNGSFPGTCREIPLPKDRSRVFPFAFFTMLSILYLVGWYYFLTLIF